MMLNNLFHVNFSMWEWMSVVFIITLLIMVSRQSIIWSVAGSILIVGYIIACTIRLSMYIWEKLKEERVEVRGRK